MNANQQSAFFRWPLNTERIVDDVSSSRINSNDSRQRKFIFKNGSSNSSALENQQPAIHRPSLAIEGPINEASNNDSRKRKFIFRNGNNNSYAPQRRVVSIQQPQRRVVSIQQPQQRRVVSIQQPRQSFLGRRLLQLNKQLSRKTVIQNTSSHNAANQRIFSFVERSTSSAVVQHQPPTTVSTQSSNAVNQSSANVTNNQSTADDLVDFSNNNDGGQDFDEEVNDDGVEVEEVAKCHKAMMQMIFEGGDADDICIVCQSALFEGVAPGFKCLVVWGKCGHAFHLQCVSTWLQSQNNKNANNTQTCPTCRQEWDFSSSKVATSRAWTVNKVNER